MKMNYRQLSEITGFHMNTIRNRLLGSSLEPEHEGPGTPKLWESAEALLVIYEAEFRRNRRQW
ncbi:hypothetical protein DESC_930024 [Desulfosarcina cetonica]|nr:hypothetical protein DESC_930024 [Desulfosarcina cetonica]